MPEKTEQVEAGPHEAAEGRLGRAVQLQQGGHDRDVPLALAEAQVHASLAIAEQLERLNDNLERTLVEPDGGSAKRAAWKVRNA